MSKEDRFFWQLFAAVVLVGVVAYIVGCASSSPWPECDRYPGAYVQAAPGVGETCR